MNIIDFEIKGNAVKFALGDYDCTDYWGDDWDDAPYEHNAGPVYDKFVKGYATIYFPFDFVVMEPSSDWNYRGNTPFSKQSFKDRKTPCVIAEKEEYCKFPYDSYSRVLTDPAGKFYSWYFGDYLEAGEFIFKDGLVFPLSGQKKTAVFKRLGRLELALKTFISKESTLDDGLNICLWSEDNSHKYVIGSFDFNENNNIWEFCGHGDGLFNEDIIPNDFFSLLRLGNNILNNMYHY